MNFALINVVPDLLVILILVLGIWLFRSPQKALIGNLVAASAIALSLAIILYRYDIHGCYIVIGALLAGTLAGARVAMKATMIQVPAMVAFQHGAGGIAALLVAFVESTGSAGTLTPVGTASGVIGIVVGSATFSGSMVASAKLSNRIKQVPTVFKWHNGILIFIALFIGGTSFSVFILDGLFTTYVLYSLLVVASVVLGVVFSIRIGGADMPVLISFLNATAGLAASFCGVIIENKLLVACGATVAASGSILTHVMCKSMNRSIVNVFVGASMKAQNSDVKSNDAALSELFFPEKQSQDTGTNLDSVGPLTSALAKIKEARSVVFIPGYGMALAQAQRSVAQLARLLEESGIHVKFAIHPVAGRMPGHMNVLLAEVDIPYDQLIDIDDVNPEFKNTDAVIIVGACDVVNVAAMNQDGSPISGMPILMAQEAKDVVVCNLDNRPGYSGVTNPLYFEKNVIMLLGDANETITGLIEGLHNLPH